MVCTVLAPAMAVDAPEPGQRRLRKCGHAAGLSEIDVLSSVADIADVTTAKVGPLRLSVRADCMLTEDSGRNCGTTIIHFLTLSQ